MRREGEEISTSVHAVHVVWASSEFPASPTNMNRNFLCFVQWRAVSTAVPPVIRVSPVGAGGGRGGTDGGCPSLLASCELTREREREEEHRWAWEMVSLCTLAGSTG